MSVWKYLKCNISDYFYAVAFVLAVSFALSQNQIQMVSVQDSSTAPILILDPGHGGTDGGTQSADGVLESTLNLEVSLRLRELLNFMGIDCVMTRSEDVSLDTQGTTVREKKNSDLRNRVKLVNETEDCILLSIHQNYFSQSRYSGPQVFYADTGGSEELALRMQETLNAALAPQSNRTIKSAQGVYLMENIQKTGILIECGFLSNPAEAEKLRTAKYQIELSCAIACAAAQYLHQSLVG